MLLVIAFTVVGAAVYGAAGVRFDASTFPEYMQFIDAHLLATKLAESLWYLHAQPPGLNLMAGIGLKLFGSHATIFFELCFKVLGVALAIAAYALTLRLTDTRAAAVACVGVLVLSPAFVLYENWFMYTFCEAALLTVAAAALHKYLDGREVAWGAVFFGSLSVLVLTRSLFHVAWLVLVVGYVVLVARGARRRTLAMAVPSVLLAASWYAKNAVLFGVFSASSTFGLGLSNISTLTVPRESLAPLVARGVLSPFALVSRYEDKELIFSSQQLPPTGVEVLDSVRKAGGEYNYNNLQVIAVDRYYARDALRVARLFPANYVLGWLIANRLFFSPPQMNEYFTPANRAAALPFERVLDPLLYGVPATPRYMVQPHFGFDRPPSIEVNTSVVSIVAWLSVLVWGYFEARRGLLGTSYTADRNRAAVIGFILFTMLYVYAVSTAFELGENYRYRFPVEPLLFVSFTAFATKVLRWLAAAARRAPTR